MTRMLTLRVTGVDDDGAGDDDDDAEELNEAVDDDEQSFHQGPGAVADPNIVRWQVKMKIVMTLTMRSRIFHRAEAGAGASFDPDAEELNDGTVVVVQVFTDEQRCQQKLSLSGRGAE